MVSGRGWARQRAGIEWGCHAQAYIVDPSLAGRGAFAGGGPSGGLRAAVVGAPGGRLARHARGRRRDTRVDHRAPESRSATQALPARCSKGRRSSSIECEARKQAPRGSLIIVYAWRGPSHFNYVHLSDDTGSEQPVHNGIFHVHGGDRVRISPEHGPCALPTEGWHKVRVVYDAAAGLVETWVDGELNPSLRGADLSLGAGRVGLGSFFNTGGFRRFRLS